MCQLNLKKQLGGSKIGLGWVQHLGTIGRHLDLTG